VTGVSESERGASEGHPRLVLASASPRRRQLLGEAGFEFEVRPPAIEEPKRSDHCAAEIALESARAKVRAVAAGCPDRVVLAADTVVALGGRVIGKPADEDDARRILRALRGTRHRVVTGVAVRAGEKEVVAVEETEVLMRPVSDEAVEEYVASGESLGKAGAYAVQERGDRFIERMEGSYTNVVGLPMKLTRRLLAQFGVRPRGPGDEAGAQ